MLGDNGVIGGTLSHEYQFKTQIGEDTLLNCPVCHFSANIETYNMENCPKCKHNVKLDCQSGIEVTDTYILSLFFVYGILLIFRLDTLFFLETDTQNH